MMLLFFSCSLQEPKQTDLTQPQKIVSFSSRSSKDVLGSILKEEGYMEGASYSEFILYSIFSKPVQSTVAIDVQANFFSILHIPSGIHAYGKTETAIVDLWMLHKGSFPKDIEHVVAYGGAPWFSGGSLQRAPLIAHMGLYFHRLEQQNGVQPFTSASPHVFAGTIEGPILKTLNQGGLSCSSFADKQYWCEFPEIDLSCVEKTQDWKKELLSLNLQLPTEGMYISQFRTQEVELCLPSGCYECDTISCSKKRSSEDLPVILSHDDWSICLSKNLDEDPERTQLCMSKSSFSNKELSLYVDDCIIP
ncbi:MAG: hypothetical protein CL916_06515 [Deltaproteobacteria bacterium]|nr:hypothetical protein [Deltaproteobacteria bacterium]